MVWLSYVASAILLWYFIGWLACVKLIGSRPEKDVLTRALVTSLAGPVLPFTDSDVLRERLGLPAVIPKFPPMYGWLPPLGDHTEEDATQPDPDSTPSRPAIDDPELRAIVDDINRMMKSKP